MSKKYVIDACALINASNEYYGAAEPPVRCGESHLSGLTEPPHFFIKLGSILKFV